MGGQGEMMVDLSLNDIDKSIGALTAEVQALRRDIKGQRPGGPGAIGGKHRRASCWFSANLPEQDADMAACLSNHIPARLAHGKPDFIHVL
jgi:hypothetical protein